MYGFEVKYWDIDGNFCCVEVIASDWREAERIVGELETTSGVHGSVFLGTHAQLSEHGIVENTKLILREANPE